MKNKSITLLGLLGLCLLLGACTTPKSVEVGNLGKSGLKAKGSFNIDGTFSRSALTDKGQKKQNFQIMTVTGKEVDGFKKIQVTVMNKLDKDLNLQYRFSWYDAQGMEIESDSTSWQPLHLFGRVTRPINSVARSRQAVSFELYIRNFKYTK